MSFISKTILSISSFSLCFLFLTGLPVYSSNQTRGVVKLTARLSTKPIQSSYNSSTISYSVIYDTVGSKQAKSISRSYSNTAFKTENQNVNIENNNLKQSTIVTNSIVKASPQNDVYVRFTDFPKGYVSSVENNSVESELLLENSLEVNMRIQMYYHHIKDVFEGIFPEEDFDGVSVRKPGEW